jgi:hypothetical protein
MRFLPRTIIPYGFPFTNFIDDLFRYSEHTMSTVLTTTGIVKHTCGIFVPSLKIMSQYLLWYNHPTLQQLSTGTPYRCLLDFCTTGCLLNVKVAFFTLSISHERFVQNLDVKPTHRKPTG